MEAGAGSAERALVAVAGDVTVDWLIQRLGSERETLDFAWVWGEGLSCRQCSHSGAAAFTSALVERLVACGSLSARSP